MRAAQSLISAGRDSAAWKYWASARKLNQRRKTRSSAELRRRKSGVPSPKRSPELERANAGKERAKKNARRVIDVTRASCPAILPAAAFPGGFRLGPNHIEPAKSRLQPGLAAPQSMQSLPQFMQGPQFRAAVRGRG